MKKKFTLTLDDSEFSLVMNMKDKILDAVPRGKTTTARIIATGLNTHVRTSMKQLVQLEEAGHFSSEMLPIKYKKSSCVTRVFKRL